MSSDPWWALGAARAVENARHKSEIVATKTLSKHEFDEIVDAQAILRSISGHALLGGLLEKLDAVANIEALLIANIDLLRDETVRFQADSAVGAYLAEITATRRRVELLTEKFFPNSVERIMGSFRTLYASNSEFRLCWELRNLAQHQGTATGRFSFRATGDPERKWEWSIDLRGLFEDHAGDSRWRAAAALWEGSDWAHVLDVFDGTHQAISEVLAVLIHDNEKAISAAIDLYASSLSEALADGAGYPLAWSVVPGPEGTAVLGQVGLEPVVLGHAVTAMQGARKILGLAPNLNYPGNRTEPI